NSAQVMGRVAAKDDIAYSSRDHGLFFTTDSPAIPARNTVRPSARLRLRARIDGVLSSRNSPNSESGRTKPTKSGRVMPNRRQSNQTGARGAEPNGFLCVLAVIRPSAASPAHCGTAPPRARDTPTNAAAAATDRQATEYMTKNASGASSLSATIAPVTGRWT